MSGHSKWATIKRSKGKADAARGRIFNRIIREITVAARMGGGNPDSNPRLRSAIANARENNMPGKNVETAILKGTGQLEGVNYEEVTWEAYGPGGVAMLIDTMTDNRNRTVAEVRHVLTRHGGNIGSTNSVSYMFKKKGIIRVPVSIKDEDTLMEIVLEAGAEDLKNDGEEYEITMAQESFDTVKNSLTKLGITPTSSELAKIADTRSAVDVETQVKVMRLIDALDELDDTQHVFTNCDFSDEAAEKYSKEA